MTDQTGAGHQSASSSRTGDVDVADQSRPDVTTDIQTGGASDVGAGGPGLSSAGDDAAAAEDRQKSAEEFAREHDPAQHDVSAGEEFRQSGDWTADEAGGPQVWDAEGNLVEGSATGEGGSEPTRARRPARESARDRQRQRRRAGREIQRLARRHHGGALVPGTRHTEVARVARERAAADEQPEA